MIRFSKYIWIYILISACVLVPGIFSLIRFGLKPAIDFTGGAVLELKFNQPIQFDSIKQIASQKNIIVSDITKQDKATYIIRTKPLDEANFNAFEAGIEEAVGQKPEVLRKEIVGPILGKELLTKATIAALFAIVAILFYVAYAFHDIKFGVSAIIALIHDVLVVFGSFSILGALLGVEVDTLFVTAFLTTMSFSVHDTIVIFDRIREYRKRDQKTSFETISDIALTETMGRSLVNSFTIVFMLFSLVLMGGETVRWFALALLIGTITGTYSSPFVATPIVLMWERWERGRKFL